MIARRHQTRVSSLLAANNLTLTSVILPGQQLDLPTGATTPSTPSTPSTTTSSTRKTPSTGSAKIDAVVSYATGPGDTVRMGSIPPTSTIDAVRRLIEF